MTSHLPSDMTPSDERGPMVEATRVLGLPPEIDNPEVLRASLRRAFVILADVESPSLARLCRTSPVGDGVAITHLIPVGAITVDDLRLRAPLRAGHVMSIAIAVAEALVALHGAGLAHGAVRAEHLLVGVDGSVILTATGVAWGALGSELDEPSASGDIAALGHLMRELLGPGSAPAPLVMAALRASDPDPFMRPDAVALLGLLMRAGRSDPVLDLLLPARSDAIPELPVSAGFLASAVTAEGGELTHGPSRDRGGHDRWPERGGAALGTVMRPRRIERTNRRAPRHLNVRAGLGVSALLKGRRAWWITAAVAVVFLLAAHFIMATGRDNAVAIDAAAPSFPTSRTPSESLQAVGLSSPADGLGVDRVPDEPRVDWATVLDYADTGRLAAISTGSPEALRDFVEPTGTAWAADIALLERIRSSKATIEGGELVIEQIDPIRIDATSAVLRVRDRRAAYQLVVDGVRTDVPPRTARWWTITLRRSESVPGEAARGAWRISAVTPLVRAWP